MPQYQWQCPQCGKSTVTINPMRDSHIPPEKCSPEAERTGETDTDGAPVYRKYEACGYAGDEVWTEEKPSGWKKLITGVNFQLMGRGWFRDGYS